MKVCVANRQDFGSVRRFSDQIEHRGGTDGERRAEREADHGAKVIFELTGQRAFDRPMTGIVDAWGHLVGKELAVLFEKFDTEHAYVLEFVEYGASGLLGRSLDCWIEMRRG